VVSRSVHGRRVRLGPGGEFDLIRRVLAGAPALSPAVVVGPGDDCAVVDADGPMALTTDLSIEDVHFRRAWLTPEEVGWRAGASALSDLAAVAAEPVVILVSLALAPEDVSSGWGERVMAGIEAAARDVGASLVGGDVSRSPGPAIIDVVAAGRAASPVLRCGARAGDEVWVTGALGGAGAAVELLEAGRPLPDALRRALARPVPRVREALWLAGRADLHALIDLSDGLAGDLGHIAAASNVAVELETARVPVAPATEAARPDPEERLMLALTAGEDYELCIVAAPGALEPLTGPFRERFGIALTRVGGVRGGQGVWMVGQDSPPRRLERGGFSHFAPTAEAPPGPAPHDPERGP